MNPSSISLFAVYVFILIGMLFLARRSIESKRKSIKTFFSLDPHKIRSQVVNVPIGALRNANMTRKITSTVWALAFVMAGVFFLPIVSLGDNVWVQILSILSIELVFLLGGLVLIKETGITDGYLECYTNCKFYRNGSILTMLAMVLGNCAYFVTFNPLGLLLQMVAIGVMAASLYIMIYPLREEAKYYT